LAGAAAGEDVDGLDLVPVDGLDVAEVRDVGVVVSEQLRGGFVVVADPGELGGADGVGECVVEAAVAGEQASDGGRGHGVAPGVIVVRTAVTWAQGRRVVWVSQVHHQPSVGSQAAVWTVCRLWVVGVLTVARMEVTRVRSRPPVAGPVVGRVVTRQPHPGRR
jgi:predicted RecA/RadA family phage recombinase